ncbi:TetR/AcrR family transcriptional regulator [Beijerinckia sp. L45]|uniref:TetR/AcrR family transcriptional regulator n=1 Tax=Beijerinckia sp. L45 TaxID=1641855 RepID=UPI00131C1B53|nr:TetR/AcrR family transcriptional regulator [Beijerinckia sp. L45]
MQDQSVLRSTPIPRGQKRRREIAAVAERMFFAQGFSDTTMQTIATEAGASKETLYRHFGSKEGLFSEIVESRANRFIEGLDENFRRPGTVGDILHNLGTRMLEKMMDRNALCLYRIVVAESPRNPDLGRIFFEQGPEQVKERLTQFLAIATRRGEISCAAPVVSAKIFLGAIITYYHMLGLVLPERPPATRVEIKAHVDEAVAMFLQRYKVEQT